MRSNRLSHQNGWVEKYKQNGEAKFRSRWWVRDGETTGGWRKKSKNHFGCSSKKEAKRLHAEHMRLINDGNLRTSLVADANLTFVEFAKGLWQDYLDSVEAKPSTRHNYATMLKVHLLPTLGGLRLESLDTATISGLFGKLRAKGLSSRSRLNVYTLLNTMCKIALEYDLMAGSPVRTKIHRPRYMRREKPILSADQTRKVLAEVEPYWRLCFLVDSILILRVGELLALRWCNFNEEESTIRVEKTLYRGKLQDHVKTEKSEATMPVPPRLKEALLRHKAKSAFNRPEDYIFCRQDGSAASADHLRRSVLYPAMDRAGIKRTPRDFGFHILRHSGATIAHKEKGLKQAQNLLRHSKSATTADIYIHPSEEEARDTLAVMEEKIFDLCPIVAPSEAPGSQTVQ